MLDNRQVMRNEDIGQLVFFLQIHHQIQNLGLNGNIQRRHRFVANDELGIYSHRSCDADTLSAPAIQLVWIRVDKAAGKPNSVHELRYLFVHLALILANPVYFHGVSDNLTDRHTRINACIWILENDLHLMMHFPHFLFIVFADILTAVQNLTTGWFDETQDCSAKCRFSATRFTYDTKSLASFD